MAIIMRESRVHFQFEKTTEINQSDEINLSEVFLEKLLKLINSEFIFMSLIFSFLRWYYKKYIKLKKVILDLFLL